MRAAVTVATPIPSPTNRITLRAFAASLLDGGWHAARLAITVMKKMALKFISATLFLEALANKLPRFQHLIILEATQCH